MAADLELHQELEERLERFGTTNPLGDYTTNLFDPSIALYAFGDSLTGKEVNLCKRRRECSCKKGRECECDDEEFIVLKLDRAEVLSNCQFQLIFSTVEPALKLNRKKELLRAFLLDDAQNETTIFDLYGDKIIIHTMDKVLSFDLDEPAPFKFGLLTIGFNYMQYSE